MQSIVEGRLFHGGVYSGNALVMAAADAVLDEMLRNRDGIYRHLDEVSSEFAAGRRSRSSHGSGCPHHVHQVGPMVSMFLTHGDVDPITNYRDVRRALRFRQVHRVSAPDAADGRILPSESVRAAVLLHRPLRSRTSPRCWSGSRTVPGSALLGLRMDLSPLPILDAAENYRGEFVDLDAVAWCRPPSSTPAATQLGPSTCGPRIVAGPARGGRR